MLAAKCVVIRWKVRYYYSRTITTRITTYSGILGACTRYKSTYINLGTYGFLKGSSIRNILLGKEIMNRMAEKPLL